MRWLRHRFSQLGGSAPATPGFIAFFSPEWLSLHIWGQVSITCPRPFRPLNRSLGLLPSIALSRPVQVGSVSITSFACSTEKQRMAPTPLTSCLTPGVQFSNDDRMREWGWKGVLGVSGWEKER